MDFKTYFMSQAYLAALKSKDQSTKVGAVITSSLNIEISKGYNGPCRGMDDTEVSIHQQPEKSFFFEHAERNAIFQACRNGVSCIDGTIYVPYAPCAECARAIVQVGIKRVVVHQGHPGFTDPSPRYAVGQEYAQQLYIICGIDYEVWDGVPVIKETTYRKEKYLCDEKGIFRRICS